MADTENKIAADAVCVGCKSVTVTNITLETAREKDLSSGSTVFAYCNQCDEEQPKNIIRFLSGINRNRGTTINDL